MPRHMAASGGAPCWLCAAWRSSTLASSPSTGVLAMICSKLRSGPVPQLAKMPPRRKPSYFSNEKQPAQAALRCGLPMVTACMAASPVFEQP
jgi:hypothetical protein